MRLQYFRTTAFLGALVCFSFLGSRAIEAETLDKHTDHRRFLMVGGNLIDINALNSTLKARGYPQFTRRFLSLGLGGYRTIQNVLFGLEAQLLIGGNSITSTGNRRMSLFAGYGSLNVGYRFYSRRGINLYPLLGLGAGGVRLKITKRQVPSFDDVLKDPGRGSDLTSGNIFYKVGFGFDYLLAYSREGKKSRGIVLGVQIGFIYSFIRVPWKMDTLDISGGPRVGITGPYFSILIGRGITVK